MAEEAFMEQFINGEGEFKAAEMHDFSRSVGLPGCGPSYEVIAIIGPQSSGKSTLMNHLFGTKFKEMVAKDGRKRETEGIWIGKSEDRQPLTLVMDLEGTDSGERGQDDTTFEKQSSLFAIAVADVVLINISCKDIGLENASNKPLFRCVFQAMMRLINDPTKKRLNNPTKKTLIYVIRDKSKTPLEKLELTLRKDIQEIWDKIIKPQAYKDTPLTEIFNVKVTALPNYELEEQEFKNAVAQLRQRYFPSILPSGLACVGPSTVLPGSAFCSSAQKLWEMIKENKDLDLPAHRIMVATVRCDEIANEKLSDFASDKDWKKLEKTANARAFPRFGERATTILNTHLSKYNEESQYFDKDVRDAKRQDLESKAFQLVYPTYKNMLRQLQPISLGRFEKDLKVYLDRGDGFAAAVSECARSCTQEFDRICSDAAIEQAKWDASEVRDKLQRDIEAHALHVRYEKLQVVLLDAQNNLSRTFERVVKSLFEDGRQDPWPLIRRLLDKECAASGPIFSSLFAAFELDPPTAGKMVDFLKKYAKILVVNVATDRADTAVSHMNNKFDEVNPKAKKHTKNKALKECVMLLSAMAVIRLDESRDHVQYVLHSVLINGVSAHGNLDSSTWDNVTPENTLITPIKCRILWEEFLTICEMKIRTSGKVQGGSWKIPIAWFLVPLTQAAGVIVRLLYPAISIEAATIPLMWLINKAMRLLFSNGLGVYKKPRDFYESPKQISRVTPITIKITELLSVVLDELMLRSQPMAT